MHKLELTVKSIHKSATKKPFSCLATCESLASRIFVETGKRPDIYKASSYHYHLRLHDMDIVDPTLSQFFNVPQDYKPKVFIGSLAELKQHLEQLEAQFGFNENNLYVKANRPRSADDIFHLWTRATVTKSGRRLRKMVISRTGQQRAWYE